MKTSRNKLGSILVLLGSLAYCPLALGQSGFQELSHGPSDNCDVWCAAKCLSLDPAKSTADCLAECQPKYSKSTICSRFDNDKDLKDNCKLSCDFLSAGSLTNPPHLNRANLRVTNGNNNQALIELVDVADNDLLYIVEYYEHDDLSGNWNLLMIGDNGSFPYAFTKPRPCSTYAFKVAPVNAEGGFGAYTENVLLRSNDVPKISRQKTWLSFINTTYFKDLPYYARDGVTALSPSTIIAYYKMLLPEGFDSNRYELNVIIQKGSCASNKVLEEGGAPIITPVPRFERIENTDIHIVRYLPQELIQGCQYLIVPEQLRDKQCDIEYRLQIDLSPNGVYTFACDKILNSQDSSFCEDRKNEIKVPFCGLRLNYTLTYPKDKDGLFIQDSTVTVDIDWKLPDGANIDPLYFVLIWGEGTAINEKFDQLNLANMTKVLDTYHSCDVSDNGTVSELCDTKDQSLRLTGVDYKTYAAQVCAILDLRDTNISASRRDVIGHATLVKIDAPALPETDPAFLAKVVGIPLVIVISLLAIVSSFVIRRTNKTKKTLQKNLLEMEENYYKTSPHDLWELNRHELQIFEDAILGRGAFGVVFKGQLLTKARAHKDANSSIATIKKRFENCTVAVKRLPDYATEPDKEKFLSEIALMKRLAQDLGFYEHIVNPLACVTTSMPYCLIMEYCSDGSLQDFLRERRTYMQKLDEAGIDYSNPSVDDNVDVSMIITVRSLVQFAVNVSYAMEHMSQMGYVHRDLAARNILVHEGRYAKVGDFGMTRKVDDADSQYLDLKGGKVPIKWLAIESLQRGEYSVKTDVWAFGVLLFEIISLGGSPYPNVNPHDVLELLESGVRMRQPEHCEDDIYKLMLDCWEAKVLNRPSFSDIRERLATKYDEITEEYNYIPVIDAGADYYTTSYPLAPKKPIEIDSEVFEPIRPKPSSVSIEMESKLGDAPGSPTTLSPTSEGDVVPEMVTPRPRRLRARNDSGIGDDPNYDNSSVRQSTDSSADVISTVNLIRADSVSTNNEEKSPNSKKQSFFLPRTQESKNNGIRVDFTQKDPINGDGEGGPKQNPGYVNV